MLEVQGTRMMGTGEGSFPGFRMAVLLYLHMAGGEKPRKSQEGQTVFFPYKGTVVT